MKMRFFSIVAALSFLSLFGCAQDVPQAHVGQLFGKTGPLALYMGKVGLNGDILSPGTHFTGYYDEIKLLECGEKTKEERLPALTKDNIQFNLDVYLRHAPNCTNVEAVKFLLAQIAPADPNSRTITSDQIYATYLRSTIGESVRKAVQPIIANEINEKREKIFTDIRTDFEKTINQHKPKLVNVVLNLSNLNPPIEVKTANTNRALQAIYKDTAITERDTVNEQTITAEKRKELARKEGANVAVKIDEIGAALRRNPEYLQYDLQNKMPEIFKVAGEKGNMIIAGPNPQVLINRK